MLLRRDLAKKTLVPEVKGPATGDRSSFRLVCTVSSSKTWAWFCWGLKAGFPLEARAPRQDFHPYPMACCFPLLVVLPSMQGIASLDGKGGL